MWAMHNLNIEEFLKSGFHLKEHLAEYLNLNLDAVDNHISCGLDKMSSLHPGSMSEKDVTSFYEDDVGIAHLFDLAAWHLGSSEYIADTLRLEKKFAHGKVLDFGGGIGTHSLAAANLKEVEHVFFVDLNPQNREFVFERAKRLGISKFISVHRDMASISEVSFDTIICFDVLEHLPNPSEQLLTFAKCLSKESVVLMNWYFYKGNNGEYPFHFDDQNMIENFFLTLQSNFVEIFHPFLITARSYKLKETNFL
ncbi:SAM-dependent methyltransferase [Prochlorococcus marinus str. SS2]|uniref:SAM-dependent methyltransferase n=2 Tax=Prochlorococcaceae TaxID=2881426 RepID=Q7VAN1_PROMA|nr:SAM-dependent methyltransferase [Prochlorococcus marinus subsp. marinus str. CCMP1375]KGG14352.1 SAM-dependent methyltransferase [Prochlorococcus marinus str. LG]KGG22074.1 SAM-dependent methyltransferase [Prochlorococcus marinus str. SS2]KGG24608.1 SAM-dependent methyltransferase [Prochlorococcus marinus str. SS35]